MADPALPPGWTVQNPRLDTSNLQSADADRILTEQYRALTANMRGKSSQQRQAMLRSFESNPNIQAIRAKSAAFGTPPPRRAGTGNLAADSLSSVGGAVWRSGIAPIPDMLAAGGEAVSNGMGNVIAGAGDAVLRAGGFPNAAQAFTDFVAPKPDPNPFRLADLPDKFGTPRPTAPGLETTAGFLGAMLLPGPKMPAPVPKLRLTPPPASVAKSTAQAVIEAGAKEGVPVFTTDVIPPTTAIGKLTRTIGEKIPFVGMGGKRAAQDAARKEAVTGLLTEYGGKEASGLFDHAPSAIDEVSADLLRTRGNLLDKFTTQKRAIIQNTPGIVEVPSTLSAIDAQIARLENIGTQAASTVVGKLKDWRQAIQGKGLPAIEAIRKEMGEAFAGQDMASIRSTGEEALSSIYAPIKQDMGNFIESAGGKTARSQWENANTQLSAMAGELSNNAFKRVLQTGEMTPENVGKLLFSKNRSDVARLWGGLSPFGQERARAAIIQKAFDGSMRAETGLSADAFATNLGKLSDQIGVTFKGSDAARIEGLKRLLEATGQAARAGVMPKTGAENTPLMAGYLTSLLAGKAAIPVAAAGGLLARAYESAPVRNALLNLGMSKPGTVAETRALANLQRLIVPVAQTFGKELGDAANINTATHLAADPGSQQQQEQQAMPPLPAGYQLVDGPH